LGQLFFTTILKGVIRQNGFDFDLLAICDLDPGSSSLKI